MASLNHAPRSAYLVGVDWGTTSLRAYLLQSPGRILETLEDTDGGMLATSAKGPNAFADVLNRLLSRGKIDLWRAQSTPVLLCGMVGSRQGWLEAPYVEAPASASALAEGLCSVQLLDGREAWIVPGMCHSLISDTAPDVMRGEETQLLGACAAWSGQRLFVLPGTHSKWARASCDGGILSFQTQMTGEFFEVLKQHSILGKLMQPAQESWPAFEAGIVRSGQPGGLLAHAFSVRTEALAGAVEATALSTYLSGILLGHEIRAAVGAGFATAPGVTLIGGEALCERYHRAFSLICGIDAHIIPGHDAVAAGLWAIWCRKCQSQAAEAAAIRWADALAACPVVAILRGITPEEALPVGKAIVEAGIKIVEVPTNSPNYAESVRQLVEELPQDVIVGAGTVLTTKQVDDVVALGGTLIVSPNYDADVIKRAKDLGVVCLPGVATPTEAFAALKAGATGLKAFPGEQLPPKILKAWKAVLPKDICLLAVGGVTVDNMQEYWEAGVDGFGIGSNIYKPGTSAEDAKVRAHAFVVKFQQLKASRCA